jgi:NAD(P)H-flavin reductase
MISWQEGKTVWALVQPQRGFSRRIKYMAGEEKPSLVWVDGPYGHPPNAFKHDTVLLIADGVGVTAHLLVIKDLLQKYRDRTARTTSIILFWQIETDGKLKCHCIRQSTEY